MNTDSPFDGPFGPSLFQMGRQDGLSVIKQARNRGASGEMMLDPKRLEAILKTVAKKKKSASRRMS
ncbi:MAG TPA: hypothetical protein VGV18_06860 [Verrucomicrobiae bacterium]|nr:hypothetical protein [Verrucomicrobiae bacterium]